jgi:hypothetical protein
MVGPMDGINLLNKSRTMATCRADGYILKPDKPIATTDACFRAENHDQTLIEWCFTYHTFSDMDTDISSGGPWRVHYHFNSPTAAMTADMVYLNGTEDYVVYNWYSGSLHKLAPTVALTPGYEGHNYAVVAPVASGHSEWAFIGETDKYVTASRLRFHRLRFGSATDVAAGRAAALSVNVVGLAGEDVKVCAAHGLKLVCQTLKFSADTVKTASFSPSSSSS